jgi:diguanylate cyclase (GGDEF)-like protein
LRQAKESAEKYANELKEVNAKLQELAYRDPLTGLFNHGHFQQLMDREVARATRYSRPFSLILFDLDHFKSINDRYGHPAGDEVLRRVSDIASGNVRQCDYVARYGGEEFAIILPETDTQGALILGNRIRKMIEQTVITVDGIDITCTISVGVYTFNAERNIVSKGTAIANADKALYFSKKNGRNKMTLYKF